MTGSTPAASWDGGQLQRADVPRAEIEASIDELATRLGDSDPLVVLRARYELALHRFGAAGAEQPFAEWAAAVAARDAADTAPIASVAAAVIGALPWCPHCDRADQAEHLIATDRPDDGLQLATRLLDAVPDTLCRDQPAGVIPALLPALLESGHGARAAHELLRAVRLLESADAGPRLIRARARLIVVCARTGHLQLGLDLLQGWIGWLRADTPPHLRMQLAAAGGRILRDVSESGHGDLLVRRPAGENTEISEISADDLGAELLREARELAARFDQRNETLTASTLVDEFLDAGELPGLPLDAVLRSPRFAAVPVRRSETTRGRRVRARPAGGSGRSAAELPALVAEFDAALAADSQARRTAVMETWRSARDVHEIAVGEEAQNAARLDGWLAIEDLHAWTPDSLVPPAEVLDRAEAAGRRLASSGLGLEALLHEQAALLAAAQSGAAPPQAVRERIESTTAQIGALPGAGADLGVALSRVALIRELAGPAEDPSQDPPDDPVALGLAALEGVPAQELTHQQARALCRLLRLEAGAQGPELAVATLERAIAALPDGVRPVERALARTDLASLLQETDLAASAQVWDAAIADAAGADAEPLMGSLLASRALVRQARQDLDGAIADLTRAVPLLDRFAPPELAAQSRFDLARVLMATGRFVESAAAAESALADVTELTERTAPDGDPDPALAHLAGCTAFSAAEALAGLGYTEPARLLAELSAGWHEANGNLVAEAEAWQLAARLGGPPRRVASDLERAAELAEIGGEWSQAATCRRDRAVAVREADGVDAALAVLADAEKALISRETLVGRHVSESEARAAASLLLWHRMALSEQRARMLAVAGRFQEAFAAADGLEDGYTALGDHWSARDLLGLRGQLRAELGDLTGALADLERAAQEAAAAGDRDQARGLGERLAMVLDQAGRSWEAEQAYGRFSGDDVA